MTTGNTQIGDRPYAWFIVTLCMIAYIFSFIDRQILALMIEPIRKDLAISDTEFSLLHGLAFSIFYATMGIPIARLADTRSRPLIISAGVFLWSLATAATGLGKNFIHVFIARMGVGVGEAALSPAAYSMIADMFPKKSLGRALAVYSIGSFIGGGLAYLIGGGVVALVGDVESVALPVIGDVRSWQVVFFAVGLPGILLALLFLLTVKDPPRTADHDPGLPLSAVASFIGKNRRFFIAHYGGFTLCALSLFALMSWTPAYLIRVHHLTTAQTGFILGVTLLVANVGGVLASGWLTDHFEKHGRRDAPMRAGMIGAAALTPAIFLFPYAPTLTLSIALIAIALFFASFPLATSAAAMQIASPPAMRAQVSAIFLFLNSVFGLAVGGTLIALTTDFVFRSDLMVGHSAALIGGIGAIGATLLLRSGLKPYAALVSAK
ncbi:MAG: spinster family MFS transporter [Parvularculaceae bacterium]